MLYLKFDNGNIKIGQFLCDLEELSLSIHDLFHPPWYIFFFSSKWPQGKLNCFGLVGSSSYRGLELPWVEL